MHDLASWWFLALCFFWVGYVVLDGFDLGVGIHMRLFARDESQRRTLLNTIGPVWDGNEVWLVTAAAATFAAFPGWYAALFSGLYVPMTLLLLCLILRAVSIEYRGKLDSDLWRGTWTTVTAVSSTGALLMLGVLLAGTSFGLPLDSNGDVVGGAFAWLGWPTVLGALAMLGFGLVHGLAFLSLKTADDIRRRATRLLGVWVLPGLAPMAVWALLVQWRSGGGLGWALWVVALLAAAVAAVGAWRERTGWAFTGTAGFAAASLASVFAAVHPVVLPSTLDPGWNLTVAGTAVAPYTLGVMTVVAAIGVPFLLLYQGWTYWVFRQRVSHHHIPAAHNVQKLPAWLNHNPGTVVSSTAARGSGTASQ
ncbi:cytochrome d ubiquinol oxidase subunit II [Kocuria rhizophila]|uniref:cytochrome d ubiquinol oxidase subunit II n=1 Tax=Kocuria rhizophila TaxID=72000 RepID=UPI000ED40015|nr:cytochrome d ubiquinol oxidase subunit II [Kocuria rhizophila]MCC5671399.1 cytochrome d ubiquinol oxidase subunit II [Kocuria rhizophila]HAG63726.1 cytochrome d ubiquinol oxidase subunit II [Kocuria sp.]